MGYYSLTILRIVKYQMVVGVYHFTIVSLENLTFYNNFVNMLVQHWCYVDNKG